MVSGAGLADRIFDAWARMQLDLIDLRHSGDLVRAAGGSTEGIEYTINRIQRDADKLKKVWQEKKQIGEAPN